jgi:hypothetical protein
LTSAVRTPPETLPISESSDPPAGPLPLREAVISRRGILPAIDHHLIEAGTCASRAGCVWSRAPWGRNAWRGLAGRRVSGWLRERFLTALDRLPQTFCHLDAFRRNLLHRAEPEGEEVVAIDWSYAGHGAVGQDLGQLVVASLQFFETVGIAPRDLDAACFAGYVAGLREAVWVGDERLARLGFTADAGLHSSVGLLGRIWSRVSDPAQRPVVEDQFGRSLEEVVAAG